MNKIVIAQARLRSSRLWGKMLYPIMDRPMLAHVIDRLQQCRRPEGLVVATSDTEADTLVADWAAAQAVTVFRGSEHDVLGRYLAAAKAYQANLVIRVCCDAPFLDPQVIDGAIVFYLERRDRVEYVSNMLTRTFPRGQSVEVMETAVLEKLDRLATEPHQREHVTPYLLEHPHEFRVAEYLNDVDLSHMNWTVDTPDDLAFVRSVYEQLYRPGEIFGMKEVLELLRHDPELAGKGVLK